MEPDEQVINSIC